MAITRRRFLYTTAAIAAGLAGRHATANAETAYPPVRTITRGPQHHWFGYYDKLQFDPTNRYVLSNRVGFEHRTPTADDQIEVGMVDLADGDRWVTLGASTAWGWQQGCMLQWVPGEDHEVIWNDRDGDRYIARRKNVQTGVESTVDRPVYTLGPTGGFALTADFARIQRMRPGYGYVGLPDPHADELAPRDSGVFRVDLATGRSELILSLADAAALPHHGQLLGDVWHYFNHLLISPDGERFIVLHRWRRRDPATGEPTGSFSTRMLTGGCRGGDLYLLNNTGMVSHFIWKNAEQVLMWTQPAGRPAGFYLYDDRRGLTAAVGQGVMHADGHCTYLPGHDNWWVLCDTYPDRQRMQRPYLFDTRGGRRTELGAFHLPPEYAGEWRCDTHPRASNDGRLVCIDSPHTGEGRQLHLIDLAGLLL